tara:strand:- start:149 stop:688 length:540 start_codon:yes stop_codon:yes gene_type:complete
MKAKIWCLGLSRTGTSTFTEILNQAGYNHIHYPTPEDMYSMGNDGCGDIPVIPAYQDLDAKFPNSKFVYTIRDKNAWLKSMEPYLERKRKWKQGQRQIEVRVNVYGDPFFDYKLYSEAYDFWENEFTKYFKNRPNDFLVLDIIGGDKPKKLFDFLEKDNYPEEFPHYNKLVDGKGVQVK